MQEDIARREPLGKLAPIGDYMGQLLPNLAYIGYMHSLGDEQSTRRKELMFKATLYAGLTTGVLKRVVNQRRPHKGDRLSFPSGHTTTAFAFASVVSLEHPQWSVESYLLAGFVGLSRMNDNAHYLHDVVAGATIGMMYGYSLFNRSKNKSKASNSMLIPLGRGFSYYYVKAF